jgi:hypothetical protein
MFEPLPICEWKREEIGMNSTMGLSRTQKGYDAILEIVVHLSMVALF